MSPMATGWEQATYDYAIVGGGTAGAVLASRLTESGDSSVLLLESGRDYRSNEVPRSMQSLNPDEIQLSTSARKAYQWAGIMARRRDDRPPTYLMQGRG